MGDRKITIGLDVINKQHTFNGEEYKMKIWDTAGSERFHSLAYSFYKSADAIIVAFDVTSIKSFQNVISWLQAIENNGKRNVPRILVATKIDRIDRLITKEEAHKYAKSYGIPYFETSSKEDIGVTETFNKLFDLAILFKIELKLMYISRTGSTNVSSLTSSIIQPETKTLHFDMNQNQTVDKIESLTSKP